MDPLAYVDDGSNSESSCEATNEASANEPTHKKQRSGLCQDDFRAMLTGELSALSGGRSSPLEFLPDVADRSPAEMSYMDLRRCGLTVPARGKSGKFSRKRQAEPSQDWSWSTGRDTTFAPARKVSRTSNKQPLVEESGPGGACGVFAPHRLVE